MLSEKRLAYYLHILQELNWPDGKWAAAEEPLTREQRVAQRDRALQLFDETLTPLHPILGRSVLKEGAKNLLDCFENKQMNKQLYFIILDVFVQKLFPELSELGGDLSYITERLAKQELAKEKAAQDAAEFQAILQREKERE